MYQRIWPKRAAPLFLLAVLIVFPHLSPTAQVVSQEGDFSVFNQAVGKNSPLGLGGGGWNIVPSPNTGHPHNYFNGVAAVGPNDVWAVGGYGNLSTRAHQLIQHWDGQNWTVATTPTLQTTYNELLAISAVSSTDVWAVGSTGSQALVEHWDGTSWSVVPTPNAGTANRLQGVAAVSSTNVWAVGYQIGGDGIIRTLVEHWDGDAWNVVPSPNVPDQHNSLTAVTAVPGSPNELWAVGRAAPSTPFILHWNGTQWSIVSTPPAGSVPLLYGVSAASANDVWAVGWTGGESGPVTLTMHWNGSSWSVVPSPNPSGTYNYLSAVTALGTNNAWAVGEFNAPGGNQRTLLLRWNGTAWLQVPGENTGPNGVQFFLRAVSAISENDIWAVGNNSHTLAEHWNGSSWSITSTPNGGVGDNVLKAVSGSASNDVWQVGYYAFGTWKQTLVEHWNGTQLSIVPSPNPNNRLNELNGVVSISSSNAWAVGSTSSGNGPDQTTLILHWDGMQWSIISSPSPGTAGQNSLYAVAANSANDVWAVGSYTNAGGFAQTLVEHWDGTNWSVIPSPNVPGAFNELHGVVALSPNNVWAVGYWGHVSFGFTTLIQHWDGNSWSIVGSPDPSGDNFLSAISATGSNDIWAAGRSRNPSDFMTSTLIVHWDGNSWSQVQGFGVQPQSAAYGVAAASVGDAWAVGDGAGLALIGRWNGNSWGVFPSPGVAARLFAATAVTPCDVWTVGQRHVEAGGLLTLSERFVSAGCATSPTRPLFDFDGDRKTDISIFRPSDGTWWWSRSSDGQIPVVQFGAANDKVTAADFTGDSKTDLAFWRPPTGNWFILRSEDFSFFSFPFGANSDIPMPADYDGDGKTDAAVFRPNTSTWFILKSSNGQVDFIPFGTAGDQPVAADYDGDGKADVGIFRPSGSTAGTAEWWIMRSGGGGVLAVQFGAQLDRAVPGDYTGDGKTDVAVWRPSNGNWFILRSEDFSYFSFQFGASGDLPAPGDYDGDGKTDAAIFRGGTWFINRSGGAGPLVTGFGLSTDVPVPNVFVR